jgi:uncharacterized protein YcbK (DUF882 family)
MRNDKSITEKDNLLTIETLKSKKANGDLKSSFVDRHSRRVFGTPSLEISSLNRRLLSAVRALLSFRSPLFTGFAIAAIAGLCLLSPARRVHASTTATVGTAKPKLASSQPLSGMKYELKLHHLHTGESLDVVYRIGNTYIPSAMAELNHFLRDHRTQDVAHYDPKEFDLLHSVLMKLGRPEAEIDVVCGYRTPWSNNFLRTKGGTAPPSATGVAEHSQHMLSKAIDIRIPGVQTRRLRDAALSLHEGGVGYYPVSHFVHVDVGPVRQWSFSGKGE